VAQSPLEIIESILFGAAMAVGVAYAVYTLMLIWDRVASLCAVVASYVSRKISRQPRPPSTPGKAALRRS
jgi:hypothetical protein